MKRTWTVEIYWTEKVNGKYQEVGYGFVFPNTSLNDIDLEGCCKELGVSRDWDAEKRIVDIRIK